MFRPSYELHKHCQQLRPKHVGAVINNDVNNQQYATTFSFINFFNSALHVSGDKFAHPQEHFFTVYTALVTMRRHCCRTVHRSAAVSVHCNKSCIYSQKCSWWWANLSPETCRAELKRLINEKGCCILLVIYIVVLKWCTVTQTSSSVINN